MPKHTTILLLATAFAGTVPVAASAQDVLVMRRAITKGVFQDHSWDTGPWTGAAACSDTATETRTVRCMRNDGGTQAADANCSGTKPEQTRSVKRYDACSYTWSYSVYSAFASACSDMTYRTRTATCMRSGAGSPVIAAPDQTSCTGAVSPLREDVANYAGCTYAWRVTQGGACVGAKRSQTPRCERSGGTTAVTTVSDETLCGLASKPPSQVDDPICAGVPQIVNGDFENDLTGWASGHGTNADMVIETRNGSKAATLYSIDNLNGASLGQVVDVKPGASVTVSYDLALVPGKFPGQLSSSARNAANGSVIVATTHDVVNTTPTSFSISFTVPAGVTKVNFYMVGWAAAASGANKPTAFTIDNYKAR